MSTALILSGGGARASYQVGVLRGISEIIGKERQPFEIICGTSAGAINAAYMASYIQSPGEGVARLYDAWREISAADVYDTSWSGVLKSLGSILWGVISNSSEGMPSAMLDNAPLRQLLSRWLDFDAIRNNIASGVLRDLCITAMNYSTGESVAFHEGADPVAWRRVHRVGQPAILSIDHIMASSAIPILFPPQTINGHYFGDGALRQLNPLSPALHLGARRLFIVGVSANPRTTDVPVNEEPPTIAQMAGHLLNREFIDNLEADIEHAEKINELVAQTGRRGPERIGAHGVEILVITPSISFDEVATRYISRQPSSMRLLFRLIGARGRGAGASFASYLLFDGGFCTELIDAGYRDAMDSAQEIRAFLS
ncbi:MAG: patatin-like phospholipase family protein [Gammaproteobacteria bacterium]|nr:patatin-like phospholipase family protein [Gammaproteobacteria bacterium]